MTRSGRGAAPRAARARARRRAARAPEPATQPDDPAAPTPLRSDPRDPVTARPAARKPSFDALELLGRPSGEPVVEVRDVRKWYGQVRAVDGVSFEVMAGEVFGLLGPN